MANCTSLISAGYERACSRTPKKGLKKEIILINYDEIDHSGIVRDSTSGSENIVTTMPLLTGKMGYAINQFKDPYSGTKKEASVGSVLTTWDKTLVFHTVTRDQAQSIKLHDALANGKFVAIVQNEDMGSDSKAAFEIIGLDNGLILESASEDPYSDESYSGCTFTLKETGAIQSATYLFSTTYAATKTVYESYKTAASA